MCSPPKPCQSAQTPSPAPTLLHSVLQLVKALGSVRSLADLSSLLARAAQPLDMQAVTAIGSCLARLAQPRPGPPQAGPPTTLYPPAAPLQASAASSSSSRGRSVQDDGSPQQLPGAAALPAQAPGPRAAAGDMAAQPEPLPKLHAFAQRVWQPMLLAQLPSSDAAGLSMCLQVGAAA